MRSIFHLRLFRVVSLFGVTLTPMEVHTKAEFRIGEFLRFCTHRFCFEYLFGMVSNCAPVTLSGCSALQRSSHRFLNVDVILAHNDLASFYTMLAPFTCNCQRSVAHFKDFLSPPILVDFCPPK